jgi:copper(I)-binding protein
MMKKRCWWRLLWVCLLLTACGQADRQGPSIRIENAWARPVLVNLSESTSVTPSSLPTGKTATLPPMDMHGIPPAGNSPMMDTDAVSAAYFVIVNDGGEEDSLIGVSSDAARDVSLHQTRYKDDIAEMVMIQEIVIPAGKTIELRPGSYHVMLVGVKQDLVAGDTIELTLRFKKSGEIPVTAEIMVK